LVEAPLLGIVDMQSTTALIVPFATVPLITKVPFISPAKNEFVGVALLVTFVTKVEVVVVKFTTVLPEILPVTVTLPVNVPL
jgi:hypothetical protein